MRIAWPCFDRTRVLERYENVSGIWDGNLDLLGKRQLPAAVAHAPELSHRANAKKGDRISPGGLVPQLGARIHVLVDSDIKWRFRYFIPRFQFMDVFNDVKRLATIGDAGERLLQIFRDTGQIATNRSDKTEKSSGFCVALPRLSSISLIPDCTARQNFAQRPL